MKKYVIDDDVLMQEWDWNKNTDLNPNVISIGSEISPWWKCLKCGKEWKARVNNRVHGTGCPACAELKRIETKMKPPIR